MTIIKNFIKVFIIVCITIFELCCASPKKTLKETNQPIIFEKPSSLMAHQQVPIDYLNAHPEIKGLLINHYMGTGKTFLALGFAESNPHHEIIILAPDYLRNNWLEQLQKFKVHNPKRYQFISFTDAVKNISPSLFMNKILIIDEAHNFIRYLNGDDPKNNQRFSELFQSCKKAKRILALTGTPIYQDVSDIAVLINLVAGEDMLPYSREKFRVDFSEKISGRSFWRGQLFESNILYLTIPVFFSFLSFALLATPLAIIPAAVLSAAVIPLSNNTFAPLERYALRKGTYQELIPHLEKHLSYFKFENPSLEDFPKKTIHSREVPYSTAQMDFFLRYIEEDLQEKELALLYQETTKNIDPHYVRINGSRLNKDLKLVPGHGREIGNLSLQEDGAPPKFKALLEEIEKSPGKVAIYSNYFTNGIKQFYEYLCSQKKCADAAIVDPADSNQIQAQKINDYNNDKKKILLFTFTEGVNLFKTRQLHILEPVLYPAILEQVIGRAVRFRSHAALSDSERHVEVFTWKSVLPSWDWESYQLKRQNWRMRYGELSQYSNWGTGLSQIDKNYYEKLSSPDEQVSRAQEKLARDSQEIMKTMEEHSIERQ